MHMEKVSILNFNTNPYSVAFGQIKPEYLFINHKGFGKDTKWAKAMVDTIEQTSKKIQKGETDFDKILAFVAENYRKYYRKKPNENWFGFFRTQNENLWCTPLYYKRYNFIHKRINNIFLKDSHENVEEYVDNWVLNIKRKGNNSNIYKDYTLCKAHIHKIRANINGEKVPLTTLYKFYEFFDGKKTYKNTLGKKEGFMIQHTSSEYIPTVLLKINTLYNRIISDKSKDLSKTTSKIAEIHWFLCQATPFKRGSAGIADMITKSIFEAKGIQVSPWRKDIAPDLEALITPLNVFKEKYTSFFRRPLKYMD